MFREVVLGLLLAAACAAPAEADEPVLPISTNYYLGMHGGFGSVNDFDDFPEYEIHEQGPIGGIHAGINLWSGPLMIGVEADFDTGQDGNFGFEGYDSEIFTIQNIASLRGRFGFSNESMLFYGTGGVARATYDAVYSSPYETVPYTLLFTGFVLGAGIEANISDHVALRVEGLHYHLMGSDDRSASELYSDVIRVGLSAQTSAPPKAHAAGGTSSIRHAFYAGVAGSKSAVENNTNLFDLEGPGYGLHAGVNFISGNVLMGFEGDYQTLDIQDRVTLLGATASVEFDDVASLRGRFGFTNDAIILYGTAGVATSEGEIRIQFPPIGFDEREERRYFGLVAGAGIEFILPSNWSARFEGLSYKMTDADDNGRLDLATIRGGLSFHFPE